MRKHLAKLMVLIFIGISFVYASGSVRLLITRPNNFGYSADIKTAWLSSSVEAFLYFRIGAISQIEIIPLERISAVLSSHRKFDKRISKSKYLKIARELNATHVLYTEYELKSSKEYMLYYNVIPVGDPQNATKAQVPIPGKEMNSALNEAIIAMIKPLGISNVPKVFFSIDILGNGDKSAKKLGTYLITGKIDDKKSLESAASSCAKLIKSDKKMHLALYAGSKLYTLAGQPEQAMLLMQQLVGALGTSYPRLYIDLAGTYRDAGMISEAKKAIDRVAGNKELKHIALWEKGMINEATGNMAVALKSFKTLSSIDAQNPNIFIHMGLTSLALRNNAEADSYVQKAAALTNKEKEKIYVEIGDLFIKNKDEKNAIKAYKQAIKANQNYAAAWLNLAELQQKQGNDSAAAISYIALFNIDYIKYPDYLEKGGELLVKKGLTELARKSYAEAFKRHKEPKVAVMLASLEYKKGNCEKAVKLVEPLGAPWDSDAEVKVILAKCNEDKTAPVITLKGKKIYVIERKKGKYVDPGATARDNQDGDLTYEIKKSGSVNVAVVDTYTITYTVQDDAKNIATAKRTIIVTEGSPPKLRLLGAKVINLKVGQKYDEPGAQAKDSKDHDISRKIRVVGSVDAKTPGTYKLKYTVKDASGVAAAPVFRKVIVAGDKKPPTISIIGGSPMKVSKGKRFKDPGVVAEDDVDGNLSNKVVKTGTVDVDKPGMYSIKYSVSDKAGNKAFAERIVKVVKASEKTGDKTIPVITLIGGSPNTITVGDNYEEPGVNAVDDVDGDITGRISIEGEVNPDKPGNYSIVYKVQDKAGNVAKKVLRVRVKDKSAKKPEIFLSSNKSMKKKKWGKSADDDSFEPVKVRKKKKRSKRSKRKFAIGLTTGALTAGFLGFGLFTDFILVPKRTEEYRNADKDDVESKRKALEQTDLMRKISYATGLACGTGFTITIFIPSNKQRK